MFPILPLITGLLQKKQQDAAAKKQNEVNALQGNGAQPQATGGMRDFAAGQVGNMLGSLGGGDKEDPGGLPESAKSGLKTGNARYDSRDVMPGYGGMTDGTANLLDDQFGAPGSVSEEDLLAL